jgi:chloramphenicol O-acetyltransferase type A
MFHYIDLENWERREHFEYYRNQLKCSYNLTVQLDVTNLLKKVKQHQLKFYPCMIYCISKIVNETQEFKMAVDSEGKLGYYDVIHPNYTIFHEDDKTFSDVWTEYSVDFKTFYQRITDEIKFYKDKKGIKVKANQPQNFFCISCVPWLSYTNFSTSVMEVEQPSLFPIITFGKFMEVDDCWKMPFTVNIAHAVADGYHTAKLINDIQNYINLFDI